MTLYFVWTIAANIQKEALKNYLSKEWSLNLDDEKITTDGFPFKFGLKVSNFQGTLKDTPLSLQFLNLEIVRLIYNFSNVILFLEKPIIARMDYPKFNISSNKLKVSISDRPFSGRFRLITEQEDWYISDDSNINRFKAKKVLFALKDANKMKFDFYFQANDIGFSFLNKVHKGDPERSNKLIIKGTILNSFMNNSKFPYHETKMQSITLKKVDMNIGFFNLDCDDMVTIKLTELTTEGNFNCLLKVSSQDISQIETDNNSLKNIMELIHLILMIKKRTNTAEPQVIPINFSLTKGLFYINTIPIYQFPKKN